MKHFFTLFAFLITLNAFSQNSNLIVFNNSGQQFFVVLNGVKQNSIPKTNVKIEGLNPTAYKIKIIFADGKTGDIDKSVYLESNMEYSAQVDLKKGKKRKLKLFNMVALNTSPYGNGAQTISYRANDGAVYSDQQIKTNQSGTHTHADGTVHNHQVVTNGTVKEPKEMAPLTHANGTHTHADGTVHDHNHQVVNQAPLKPLNYAGGDAIVNADGSLTCKSSVNNIDLLISEIKAESFSSDQMNLVKTGLKNKCINSDQAYRIVNSFTFDGDKIAMSKFCYDHMTDKENAKKLLDLFSFSSSKDELKKYFSNGK